MAHRAILVGQHGIRSFPEKGVAEGQLLFRSEAALCRLGEDFALDERHEPTLHHAGGPRGRAPEESRDARSPEQSPEHARCPQDSAGLGVEAVETGLCHGEHALGERSASPFRDRADQLLDVERVSARPLHDGADVFGGGARAEHVANEALAGARRELSERQGLHPPLRPQLREQLVDLGARHREHHEGKIGQPPERRVDEPNRREVSPVQILEHEEHGLRPALGGQEVLPGAPHLIAHQHRILARRTQLHTPFVGEGHAEELAQEIDDPRGILRRHVAHHSLLHLDATRRQRLVGRRIHRRGERLREDREGCAGAHRIAPPHPHLDGDPVLCSLRTNS